MKNEYQIKLKETSNDSEETSSVSLISYEIENAKDHGLTNDKIKEQVRDLSRHGNFPQNLKYVESYSDPGTGTTSTAFLNKDTGKVIVGMTGTNVHMEQVKKVGQTPYVPITIPFVKSQDYKDTLGTAQDVGADVNIGIKSVTHEDVHFKKSQAFIKKIKKNHEIDTITGHSLGGRDAIILGTSNDIQNIVVYNTAPITVKTIRKYIPFYGHSSSLRDESVDKLIKKYDGNILRIVSEKDELTNIVDKTDYVFAGNQMVIKNGKGHSMSDFLGKREQREIKARLNEMKGYKDANSKSFVAAKKQMDNKLEKVDEVRANMLQMGGGALSSSQQKLLESVTALSIAESMNKLIEEETQQLEKMYRKMEEKFEKNWEDAQESGMQIGEHLSTSEVLEALDAGGANESNLVIDPKYTISYKIQQLTETKVFYSLFILKVQLSIDDIVEKDQMLANQIGDLI